MPPNPLRRLEELGQSVWLDRLSRALVREGELDRLVDEDGLSGITSNPSIFHKAISTEPHYRADLARLKTTSLGAEQRYESLVIPDVREACDRLRPTYERSGANDGYVSLEVSPRLAYDAQLTVRAAQRLRESVARDNLLVKVPATHAGLIAFEELVAQGVNVNVTLMFSLTHARKTGEAYIRGARRWLGRGGDPRSLKSVASLFLSRVDTWVDGHLQVAATPEALALRGLAGVALAKLAYRRYKAMFHGAEFENLATAGVRPQYLLWASTGTKNARYSDLLYVEPLIGAETITTMPDSTLAAFRAHGSPQETLEEDVDAANEHMHALEQYGVELSAAGETLQAEGVRSFDEAYGRILELVG